MIERRRHRPPLKVSSVGGQVVLRNPPIARLGIDLRKLARVRGASYRLLAGTLLYPEEDFILEAAQKARTLRARERWVAQLSFWVPWERFLQRVASIVSIEGGLDDLRNSYLRLFGGVNAPEAVSLCESAYLEPEAAGSGRTLSELESEYSRSGLATAPEGMSPDHVSVELDYLGFLCRQEEQAWSAEDLDEGLESTDRQRRFLQSHTCQWIPHVASALALRDTLGVYSLAATTADALTAHDVDFLRALSDRLRQARESRGTR